MNKSISEIVDTLYVSIGNAYHGNKSDISLTLKQMSDNVDAYLKAGDWNMAMEEAQRCQKTDASSFWGWWCILKVLTNGQAKVECSKNHVSFSIEEETIKQIKKCYQFSLIYSPDEYKTIISNYYLKYTNNLNTLNQYICLLKQNNEMYTCTINNLKNQLRKCGYLSSNDTRIIILSTLIATWLILLVYSVIIFYKSDFIMEDYSLFLIAIFTLLVFVILSIAGLPSIIFLLIKIVNLNRIKTKNKGLADDIRKKIDEVEKYNLNYVHEIEKEIEKLIIDSKYCFYLYKKEDRIV